MREKTPIQSGEKDLLIFRPSRRRLYIDVLIVILSCIGLVVLFALSPISHPTVFLGLLLLIILVGGTVFLNWHFTVYRITTIRIEYTSGIIWRLGEEMCLEDIQTVDATQSLIGRIFNFGDVVVESAANNVIILKNVHNPDNLAHQIANLSLHFNKEVEVREDRVRFGKIR